MATVKSGFSAIRDDVVKLWNVVLGRSRDAPQEAGALASHDDVVGFYNLFLGRQPESDQVVAEKVGKPLISMPADFLRSTEFKQNVFDLYSKTSDWADNAFFPLTSTFKVWVIRHLNPSHSAAADVVSATTWHELLFAVLEDGTLLRRHATESMIVESERFLDGLRACIQDADRFVGALDLFDGTTVAGWAYDPVQPGQHAIVELVVAGKVVATTKAADLRSDVGKTGLAPDHCGFHIRLPQIDPDLLAAGITARLRRTHRSLAGSPMPFARMTQVDSWLTAADLDDKNPDADHAEFIGPGGMDTTTVPSLTVAVHAHMYYADLAEEFVRHLSQIPCPFDLFASVTDETGRRAVQAAFARIPQVNRLDVRIVPNIGRDIAPFVVEFGRDLAQYDVVSHIQTKKSLYNDGSTDGWRESILNALFAAPERIALYLHTLATGRYGMIYPQCFWNLPYMANTWLANSGLARAWAPRFGVDNVPDGYFDFPAGSMFWAKTDAIRPLLEAGIQWDDFPAEAGQTDGTLAHCIERMLGVVPTSRRYMLGVIRDERTPSWSRWRLNQFIDRPLQLIHDTVAAPDVQVVAFDIFDTLLTRPMLDADYVKHVLDAEHGSNGIAAFRTERMRAEGEAREAKGRDVDIHDIYRQMDPAGTTFTPDREIELELQSVRPRHEVIALMKHALQAGKRVILASDMFLPEDAILAMLDRCGVTGWHELYLSSSIGLRKDSGKLYEHILAAEKLNPGQVVMIGDNERSDLQIPYDMGLRALHVVKPQNIMRALPRLAPLIPDAAHAPIGDQFLFGALASENFSAIAFPDFSANDMFGNSARAIGFGLLGPITVAFSQWLVEQAEANHFDTLFFLAREGKFLKQVFDLWTKDRAQPAIASKYLLISRRAVTVPAIEGMDDILAIAASNNFYGASMDMFLEERFGTVLDHATWAACERAKAWVRNRPLQIRDGNIDHIKAFLEMISPHILRQAALEREHALTYYTSEGLTGATRSAVVDVGYGATIQRHLIKLLKQDIHGLYMMTNVTGAQLAKPGGVVSKGYFVHGAAQLPTPSPLFLHSFYLEKMLSADDEQVIRYDSKGNAQFRDIGNYEDTSRAVRAEMQAGALAFAAEAVRFRSEICPSLTICPSQCETLFSNFVKNMSRNEKIIFSHLALDDFYCGRGIVTE